MGCSPRLLLLLLLRLTGDASPCAVPYGLIEVLKTSKRSLARPIVHSPESWGTSESRAWKAPEERSVYKPPQVFQTTMVLTDEEYFASFHPDGSQRNQQTHGRDPLAEGTSQRVAEEGKKMPTQGRSKNRAVDSASKGVYLTSPKADVRILRSHLEGFLSDMRNDLNKDLKEEARVRVFNAFLEYGLDTRYQNFTGELYRDLIEGQSTSGVNIIGVLPGKHRRTPKDHIIVLGAHYDTFKETKGVNDNGSGIAALLEVARVLTYHRCRLDYTVIFVALDMEEIGCVGSYYFVHDFLFPSELLRDSSKFQGAIILDTILHYNNSRHSQDIPKDFQNASPEVAYTIAADGHRGNFLASMSRWQLDSRLTLAFARAWDQQERPRYRLHSLSIPLGAQAITASLATHLNFLRSDHVMFWYHSHPSYKDSLSAILLTDTGPFRGTMRNCYHETCDDVRGLTDLNLHFVQKTTNALVALIMDLAKGSCTTSAPSSASKFRLAEEHNASLSNHITSNCIVLLMLLSLQCK
ncbi:unnamed protein product [Ixodes hexagonus]